MSVVVVALTACSGYSEKKYEKMRDQVDAMMDEMNDKIEELADED